MSSGKSRKRLAENDRGINVKLLTHGHVPRDVPGLRNWGEQYA
jgi:hypothetical protein